jgi:hypothetical protein
VKLETQSSKYKTQKNLQAPSSNHIGSSRLDNRILLELGPWNFFGTLSFELGTWPEHPGF